MFARQHQAISPGTPDKTFAAQIHKVAARFGGSAVTLVGDRDMIKGPQIIALQQQNFHFITAITKPQIETDQINHSKKVN
jgi:hypothetical protein